MSDRTTAVVDEGREFKASAGTSHSYVVEPEHILALLANFRFYPTIDHQPTLFKAHRCSHPAQYYHTTHLEKEAAELFYLFKTYAATLSNHYVEGAQPVVQISTIIKYRARAQP